MGSKCLRYINNKIFCLFQSFITNKVFRSFHLACQFVIPSFRQRRRRIDSYSGLLIQGENLDLIEQQEAVKGQLLKIVT